MLTWLALLPVIFLFQSQNNPDMPPPENYRFYSDWTINYANQMIDQIGLQGIENVRTVYIDETWTQPAAEYNSLDDEIIVYLFKGQLNDRNDPSWISYNQNMIASAVRHEIGHAVSDKLNGSLNILIDRGDSTTEISRRIDEAMDAYDFDSGFNADELIQYQNNVFADTATGELLLAGYDPTDRTKTEQLYRATGWLFSVTDTYTDLYNGTKIATDYVLEKLNNYSAELQRAAAESVYLSQGLRTADGRMQVGFLKSEDNPGTSEVVYMFYDSDGKLELRVLLQIDRNLGDASALELFTDSMNRWKKASEDLDNLIKPEEARTFYEDFKGRFETARTQPDNSIYGSSGNSSGGLPVDTNGGTTFLTGGINPVFTDTSSGYRFVSSFYTDENGQEIVETRGIKTTTPLSGLAMLEQSTFKETILGIEYTYHPNGNVTACNVMIPADGCKTVASSDAPGNKCPSAQTPTPSKYPNAGGAEGPMGASDFAGAYDGGESSYASRAPSEFLSTPSAFAPIAEAMVDKKYEAVSAYIQFCDKVPDAIQKQTQHLTKSEIMDYLVKNPQLYTLSFRDSPVTSPATLWIHKVSPMRVYMDRLVRKAYGGYVTQKDGAVQCTKNPDELVTAFSGLSIFSGINYGTMPSISLGTVEEKVVAVQEQFPHFTLDYSRNIANTITTTDHSGNLFVTAIDPTGIPLMHVEPGRPFCKTAREFPSLDIDIRGPANEENPEEPSPNLKFCIHDKPMYDGKPICSIDTVRTNFCREMHGPNSYEYSADIEPPSALPQSCAFNITGETEHWHVVNYTTVNKVVCTCGGEKVVDATAFNPGSHCGIYLDSRSLNGTRRPGIVSVPCLGHDPRDSCPSGFVQKSFYFEDGHSGRYATCVENSGKPPSSNGAYVCGYYTRLNSGTSVPRGIHSVSCGSSDPATSCPSGFTKMSKWYFEDGGYGEQGVCVGNDNQSATFQPGEHCGQYIDSRNIGKITVNCLGHNPNVSCPAGFTRAQWYFEDGHAGFRAVCVYNPR